MGKAPKTAGLSDGGARLVAAAQTEAPLPQTVARFPHVINKLAEVWEIPNAFEAVIEELIFTERPQRQGFPPEVLRELTELRLMHRQQAANGAFRQSASENDSTILDAETLRRRLAWTPPSGK